MVVEMLKGKDLYYPGEVVNFDDALARVLISMGVAREYRCPDCGHPMQEMCYGFHCPDCGLKFWR